MGHAGQLGFDPGALVQVSRAAPAPVQRGGAGDALELHVLDDGLDGGETRARGQENHGFGAVFAQVEAAVRPFNAQDVLFFQGAKYVVGELAAGHVAQVQFHRRLAGLRVRGIGHGIAAAVAVAQQKFHILTRVVLKGVAGRQLQPQHDHVVRHAFERTHAHRHFFDGECTRFGDLARFQYHVAVRHAAAGEHIAGGFFIGAQRFGLVSAVGHTARQQFALARAAGAVFAAIGQTNALANASGQNGFIGLGFKDASAGLNGDGECHTVCGC